MASGSIGRPGSCKLARHGMHHHAPVQAHHQGVLLCLPHTFCSTHLQSSIYPVRHVIHTLQTIADKALYRRACRHTKTCMTCDAMYLQNRMHALK